MPVSTTTKLGLPYPTATSASKRLEDIQAIKNAILLLDDLVSTGPSSPVVAEIPYKDISNDYTMLLTDSGYMLRHIKTDITGRTITIPHSSDVAFTIGTTIIIMNQKEAGVITLTPASGVTLNLENTTLFGSRTLNSNNKAVLLKTDDDEWTLSGSGIS